jgi:hypothetical protein
MPSQTDLDQGGTNRQWIVSEMGPTIGRVRVPLQNILLITAAGTYNIDPSTCLIEVNVAGAVTIVLPSAVNPAYRGAPTTQPGKFANTPITIVDVGGNAAGHNILIEPNNAGETILGLTQIKISVAYGGYTLVPNSGEATWNSISP